MWPCAIMIAIVYVVSLDSYLVSYQWGVWMGLLEWTTGLTFDPKMAQMGAQFYSLVVDFIPSPSFFDTVVT